ncbi:MAG: ABC transporter ATP-binding protein [Lachnospiraceae bacterium]
MIKAVEVKNISKKFGSRMIFENISFSILQGEFVALVGPSGCGKSTLLNMIGALETYDKGKIMIYGKRIPKIESREATYLRRNTINYLFQSSALIAEMTVSQNLYLAMNFVDCSRREKLGQIEEVLQKVNLLPLKDAKVNTLSGGEQQRVALARTLVKPGDLVLADEPTGALDSVSADISFELLRNLSGKYNKTVIMVTHSTIMAERAERIIDMEELKSKR